MGLTILLCTVSQCPQLFRKKVSFIWLKLYIIDMRFALIIFAISIVAFAVRVLWIFVDSYIFAVVFAPWALILGSVFLATLVYTMIFHKDMDL